MGTPILPPTRLECITGAVGGIETEWPGAARRRGQMWTRPGMDALRAGSRDPEQWETGPRWPKVPSFASPRGAQKPPRGVSARESPGGRRQGPSFRRHACRIDSQSWPLLATGTLAALLCPREWLRKAETVPEGPGPRPLMPEGARQPRLQAHPSCGSSRGAPP